MTAQKANDTPMKYSLILLLALGMSCGSPSTGNAPVEAKIDSLMALMTLREKIGQMNQYSAGPHITGPNGNQDNRYERFVNGEVGSVLNVVGAKETYDMQRLVMENSRLKIPLLFSYDVIHGYKTIFPLPLAEAASWDLGMMEKTAQIAAKESAAAGLHWTFAPMVDVSRDARWGRVMEGAGEDTYLGSQIAKARIRGFQGGDLTDLYTIAACAKHFAGYGFAESGMDYNTVLMGKHDLHNYVLPPFKAAIEADVATFMNAFNDIDGEPATASQYLVRDLLKGDWSFDGLVVSDWNSIGELMNHGVAADKAEAARLAALAGTDIDMEGDAYITALEELIEKGVVPEAMIDDAVRRILRLKFKLGLFDDPYRYSDVQRERETLLHPDHQAVARDMARKSIVLLKNEGGLLPYNGQKKIGIIGPLAKDKDAPLGNWRAQADPHSAVSFYEGMAKRFGEENILFAEGCKLALNEQNLFHQPVQIEKEDRSGFAEAIRVAKASEVVFMVLGESSHMSGEARSRADIRMPGLQQELLKAVFEVNPNVVLVSMSGRPMELSWEAENLPAILQVWHLGSQAGHAIADVVAGDYNPSGKLPMSFPRSSSQLPMYYNHRRTGRPANNDIFYVHHADVERSALFPFGHGLSYTTFAISAPEASLVDDKVRVAVTVQNTGAFSGKETVQVYIRDHVASVARPVIELKDFLQIQLEKGESKEIVFELTKDDFSFYDTSGKLVFEPGDFSIGVGNSSRDLQFTTINLP